MTGQESYQRRRRAGRARRAKVPRAASWQPPASRPDPVGLLAENNRPRLPDLVPVRYGRMLVSPFAFLRGSAAIMASDLAGTHPTVNLDAMTASGFASYAQVCGRTLARARARSGDAATISGYLGSGTAFDQAIATFADSYAEQVTHGYDALAAAVRSGRVAAVRGPA